MNRTIKEATVRRYHYQSTDELNEHLQAFLLAYNHAKRLKTLRGLTPYEFVCTLSRTWKSLFVEHQQSFVREPSREKKKALQLANN